MAHAFFQASQAMMPINTQTRHPSVQHMGPIPPAARPVSRKLRRVGVMKCSASSSSSSPVAGDDSVASLERCLMGSQGPSDSSKSASSPASSRHGPVMKKGKDFGAFGAVTLEKGKLDLSQKQAKTGPELATGGGGGDIGKKISHGGGDGGDDDGDDDDYYDDFDDGDDGDEGGLFRRRKFLEELFDRKFVDAVLYEWQKTMMDLPAGFRQAYEMGLVSSAQMVRYLAINARPTTTRWISRALPQAFSRALIGRMIADPAFLHKLVLELVATFGCSLWLEFKTRKERIKQEWDLALLNVLTVSACNTFAVWSLAPSRSYGNTFRFDLQNTLQKLPNNVFEKSYPLREFDRQKRFQSFIFKIAELCMVGIGAGAVQGGLTDLRVGKKKERLSVTTPTFSGYALGYGSFLGLIANMRYQLLCGLDRAMMNHFDAIGVGLFFSTALRVLNVQLGEELRLAWLSVEADPLYQSGDLMKTSYEQGKVAEGEAPAPKPRRKRVVRRKVTSSAPAPNFAT